MLQRGATHCSVWQRVAECCRVLQSCRVLQCVVVQLVPNYCISSAAICVLQCGATRCSVLLCVAECCGLLLRVVVCGRVLQCDAVCCSTISFKLVDFVNSHLCVAVWCNALQCVTVCCSVLQCAAESCRVLQCSSVLQCFALQLASRCWILSVSICVLQGVAVR